MIKQIFLLVAVILIILLIAGCNVLQQIAPLPDSTFDPTPTKAVVTPTPLPSLGELTALSAAYCLPPAPDAHEVEFTFLRFFRSGVVLQVTVKGQKSCSEAWAYIDPFLKESATDTFNHGEYQHSEGEVRFALAAAGSDKMSGMLTGWIEDDQLIMQQQGTEMIYDRVYGGE